MKKILLFLLGLVLLLGAGAVGLSYYKNDKIASEFSKKLDTVSNLSYASIACDGFVNADCTIKDIAYQGKMLADSVTLEGIDPRVQFKKGTFIKIPLSAKIKNAKFSLFDISSMMKNDIQVELKDFFTKYTKDYDIDIDATMTTDGESVRSVEIVKLDAKDKITPFILKAKVDKLDTFPALSNFHIAFDLSKKRVIFYDFLESMRQCCSDKIPERYVTMKNEEIWNDMIERTSISLSANVNNQFNQEIETQFMKAILVLLNDEKNTLSIDAVSKKETALEQVVMMFFLAGPDAVKSIYDIKVSAK